MATYVKYNVFAVDLSAGVHDLTTAGSTLRIALTNTAPNVATHQQLSDINQIPYTNIAETMPADTQNVGAENPAGTWEVTGTDITLNAIGPVAAFRYVVVYNDTPAGDPLIAYWDYGSSLTLQAGESFTIDFNPIIFTVD